jgi:hypothetical protein
MDKAFLVKHFGSLNAPLSILSPYPTKAVSSTVHLKFGTVKELSSLSIFYLYQKLGYAEVGQRTSSILHVDLFYTLVSSALGSHCVWYS